MGINLEQMSAGFASLWQCIRSNTWPTDFFANVLGLSAEASARIPRLMMIYVVVYLAAAVSALTLHFFQKQKSLSGWGDKLVDFLLTILAIPGLRILGIALRVAKEAAAAVDASTSVVNWMTAMAHALFAPLGIALIIIALMLIPIYTMANYVQRYGGAGVPWMIYDVGFGLFCVSSMGVAMARGDLRWYLGIPVALLLNAMGQLGGVAVGGKPGKRQGAGAGVGK